MFHSICLSASPKDRIVRNWNQSIFYLCLTCPRIILLNDKLQVIKVLIHIIKKNIRTFEDIFACSSRFFVCIILKYISNIVLLYCREDFSAPDIKLVLV